MAEIIITQTPPNLEGQAEVFLRKNDFEALIWNRGYAATIEKAMRCPCKPPGAAALSSCRNCGGMGHFFIQKTKTRLVSQSAQKGINFQKWSEEHTGMISVTTLEREKLSWMDRITLLQSNAFHSQTVQLYRSTSKQAIVGRTVYEIKKIDFMFLWKSSTEPLIRLIKDEDYTFDGNVIQLTSKWNNKVGSNPTLSVRYSHYPQYHVIDISREFINQDEKDFVQDITNNNRFPIHAMARRAHYIFDQLNYFTTDSGEALFLIDNSFEVDPCEVEEDDPNCP